MLCRSPRDRPMSANSRSVKDARMLCVLRAAFQSETDLTAFSNMLIKFNVAIAPKGAVWVYEAVAMFVFLSLMRSGRIISNAFTSVVEDYLGGS